MLLTILGLIDLVFGGVLAASPYFSFMGFGTVGALGIIALLKGLYSVLAAAAGGYYFSVMGWLDLLAGFLLLLTTIGIRFPWFLWIGIIIVIKGVYSIVTEMTGD